MRLFLGAVLAGGRKRFNDTFNRANTTTGLGVASDGSLWTALRGNMNVSSNAATSTDAATSYPAAIVTMPLKTSNEITLKGTSNGSGSVLWATDSGNWWATDVYQYTYSATTNATVADGNYTCNNGTCSNTNCPSGNYVAVYTTTNGIKGANYAYNGPFCDTWNSSNIHNAQYCTHYYYTYNVTGYYYYSETTPTGNYTCSGGYSTTNYCCSPGATANYTTQAVTTTYYPKVIRVLQSAANTVTEIARQVIGENSTIQSLKTLISGNQVTVKAYSDANAVTQVGSSLVYTATGATVTPKFGIVITPQGYSQGNTIDSVTIE